MKVTEHIEQAKGKTVFSVEIVPPTKGTGIEDLYKNINPLMEFKPAFIDVTTSREEFVFIDRGNNLVERKITRMRPGTLGICAAIQLKYNTDTVPHVLCGGFTKEETEYLLIDCLYLGIDNVMALRGDAMKGQHHFQATQGGHVYANDLVQHINDLCDGKYLSGEVTKPYENRFCIGVAGYPEKHIEAPSMQYDLQKLKRKVDAGAHYIVTQMFFDNQKFFKFVEDARAIGIDVPIIPGIKPLTTMKHLSMLPKTFKIDLPESLVKEVSKADTNQNVRQIGIEWAIQQCKELKASGVPLLHFYSMGKSETICKVAKEVF
ncbi:MAG TPA: methylenetetrahydrofolate reductase [NAD(P)H] [Edaphocola sp.]|nr:methylenetetrahydrofolate reductase [NAD(P)H] [Edaphocola sp.]